MNNNALQLNYIKYLKFKNICQIYAKSKIIEQTNIQHLLKFHYRVILHNQYIIYNKRGKFAKLFCKKLAHSVLFVMFQ